MLVRGEVKFRVSALLRLKCFFFFFFGIGWILELFEISQFKLWAKKLFLPLFTLGFSKLVSSVRICSNIQYPSALSSFFSSQRQTSLSIFHVLLIPSWCQIHIGYIRVPKRFLVFLRSLQRLTSTRNCVQCVLTSCHLSRIAQIFIPAKTCWYWQMAHRTSCKVRKIINQLILCDFDLSLFGLTICLPVCSWLSDICFLNLFPMCIFFLNAKIQNLNGALCQCSVRIQLN